MGVVCCREDLLDLDGEVELSHFTLLRSVGKGAFGKVRVVQHKGTKQLYALKYINKTKCIQMRAVENIISERRLLEQIECELIVNMRYAFQDDENLFMVLDLMLGGDLRFHLDRLGIMPEEYVRFYAAEIAVALGHLHSLNIVHRDLKPDNILLDEHGHAHLTDFNIATVINNSKPLTSIAGSFAYIAPEVLQKRGYLSSVDWWSLGIVLYELLFGKRPIREKTNDALQHAILNDPVPIPENHKISAHAIDFIKGLLTRDIQKRLGVGEQGFRRLQSHPWLKSITWDQLETKQAIPPFVPDNKRANFDPTHELEEILLEDNPLKVRKRNPKRSGTSYATSIKSQSSDSNQPGQSPERQMMEEKFITFDYTKPDENVKRRTIIEQRHWAQKMNKTDEKTSSNKAGGTYKTSVLEYVNQKPATPLSAGDILKLEELARMARSGKGNDWRPPSGLMGSSSGMNAGVSPSSDVFQMRDNYIVQHGGVPPPSRPPPPASPYDGYQRRRSSSDDSYRIMTSSPDNSEHPLMASAAALSVESPPKAAYYLRTLPKSTTHSMERPPPPPPSRPPARMSSIPRGAPLPPPTSLPPPVPSELPSLPTNLI